MGDEIVLEAGTPAGLGLPKLPLGRQLTQNRAAELAMLPYPGISMACFWRRILVWAFPLCGAQRLEKAVLLSGVVGTKSLDYCIQLILNSVECILGISQLFLRLLHPCRTLLLFGLSLL